MLARTAVNDRVGATGIVADHTADHATVLRGGFGCKKDPVWSKREVKFIADDTGLHAYPAPCRVNLQDARKVTRHIHYNAGSDDLTGQRSTGCPGYERCAVFTCKANKSADIRLGLGQYDSLRQLAINGRIGRIKRPHRRIEMKRAFEFTGKVFE